MNWKYSCPKCTAILNPEASIILLGRFEGRDTLLAFHPEPGNYEVAVPFSTPIRKGEKWNFYCPVCHESLEFRDKEDLATLNMTDGIGNWHQVLFSRIAGEYATFVITGGPNLELEKHGEDQVKYQEFFWHKYI